MDRKDKKPQQKQPTLQDFLYKQTSKRQNHRVEQIKNQDIKEEKVEKIQRQVQLFESEFKKMSSQTVRQSFVSVKSDISAKQQMPNVDFYLNRRQSYPEGDLIDQIHKKWWGNYKLLEKHHGFIQWLFPNAFKSRFNNNSYPLTNTQQKQFRKNPEIYKRYVNSYEMMLQFYGMKLKNKSTGQIAKTRNPPFEVRFYQTLLTSFHNHMRITRILCSLTMVGFGRFAKQLCIFLKKQIQSGDLKKLEKYNVYKDWKQYQKYEETEQDISEYFKNMKGRQSNQKTNLFKKPKL